MAKLMNFLTITTGLTRAGGKRGGFDSQGPPGKRARMEPLSDGVNYFWLAVGIALWLLAIGVNLGFAGA